MVFMVNMFMVIMVVMVVMTMIIILLMVAKVMVVMVVMVIMVVMVVVLDMVAVVDLVVNGHGVHGIQCGHRRDRRAWYVNLVLHSVIYSLLDECSPNVLVIFVMECIRRTNKGPKNVTCLFGYSPPTRTAFSRKGLPNLILYKIYLSCFLKDNLSCTVIG